MYTFIKNGLYHQSRGLACQDVIRAEDFGSWKAVVTADGVSAAECGGEGAELACEEALEYLRGQHEAAGLLPQGWGGYLLNRVRIAAEARAAARRKAAADYACTLMVLVVDRETGTVHCFNIGDALLLGIGGSDCRVLCMPQDASRGCPTVMTDGIEKIAKTESFPAEGLTHLVSCTDGAWKMMYRNSIMVPSVRNMLVSRRFGEFIRYMQELDNEDDCSFAILAMGEAA